jgi:hypothetical protein
VKTPAYPLTLEQALKAWIPSVKHPDRMCYYRRYLKAILHSPDEPHQWPIPATWPEASEAEIQAALAKRNRGWFDEGRFEIGKLLFKQWFDKDRDAARKGRAQKAAGARWKKAGPKKSQKKFLVPPKRAALRIKHPRRQR